MGSREEKIQELTDRLYESLDIEHVKQTGSLFVSTTRRHSQTRKQFAFMDDFQYDGRLFTEKVTDVVCQKLLDEKKIELPATPGHSKKKWIKETSPKLLALLQKSRRSVSSGFLANSSAMDDMETQPVEIDLLDPNEDSSSAFACIAAPPLKKKGSNVFTCGGVAGPEAEGLEQ